jgi:flagellar basal body P-ring formation protein FlgA
MRRLVLQLLGFCLLPLLPVHGQGAFTLRPAAAVHAAGVFAAEVFEDAAGLPTNRLALAPAAGQTLTLTRDLIAAALRKADTNLILTNWAGASAVRIVRATRKVEETELHDLIVDALQRRFLRDGQGELDVRFTRPWNAVVVPDEPVELKLMDLPSSGLTANLVVRFELRSAGELFGQWYQPIAASLWREVPVANAPVRRGQLLSEADLGRERRDLLTQRDVLTELSTDAAAFEFTESLNPGQTLRTRSLRARPVVTRGQLIDAIVQSGTLEIVTKAEAMEDGAVGQFIRIRNPKSKREFRAKVQNEETVVVPL